MVRGPTQRMNIIVLAATFLALACDGAVIGVYNFSGPIPYTGLDFFFLPFAVPAGTAEVQVDHAQTDVNTSNILDWGLNDPDGFRGWGGGNAEPAIVGAYATSRSYVLKGSLLPVGNWSVVVGKPRIASPPGHMSVNVTLRDSPTLAPQPHRAPYVVSAPLRLPASPTWYAGDFHVHCRESGDAFASATLDEIASFGRSVGLDFVHVTDHNTVSAASFMVDAQGRHPDTLLLPGVEFTTYYGHAGALFTTQYVDHKLGLPGVSPAGAAAAIRAQGGLLAVNHLDMYEPGPDLRNACVGCAWDLGAMGIGAKAMDAVEVGIQSWGGVGWFFSPAAIQYWDHLHALGYTHIAPIGGSDDHHGGANETVVGGWHEGSPLGSPTTMVLAANLSHAAIREGVAAGRTVVKMNNASDPDLDLTANATTTLVRVGETVAPGTASVTLTATVSLSSARARRKGNRKITAAYPLGLLLVLVRNNELTYAVNVTDADPFVFSVEAPAPVGGTDRWRAELHDSNVGAIRVLTNHIFLPGRVT